MSDKSSFGLSFSTKISPPRLFDGLVLRQDLIKRMLADMDRRVTLILGGAGYGKTTLAVQLLQQLPTPTAWLSADTTDNDPYQFLRSLVNSVRVVFPDSCVSLLDLIKSPQSVPVTRLADAFVGDLADQNEKLVLVIDDLHLVTSDEVHEFLMRVTQLLPTGLHLVFTSRKEPPWPLPLWRSRGWVREIDSQQLSFSTSESEEFFQTTLDRAPDKQAIASLHQQTEGWPAGLRFMQLSLQNEKDPGEAVRNFKGDNREISRYLASELLEDLPSELRHFVERTAPLDRFCPELCDAVIGSDAVETDVDGIQSSRQCIDELLRQSLFIVPLDQDGMWYRYHHLFQKLVLQRLREKSSEAEHTVYRRAGRWFESQGCTEDALAYLLRADDVDEATRVFWQALPSIMQADLSRRNLARLWLSFPNQARAERPELLLAEAFVKMVHQDVDGLARVLLRAEKKLNETTVASPTQSELRAVWKASSSFSSFWNGDTEAAWQHGTDALGDLPERFRVSRTYATVYSAGGLLLSGRKERAFAFIDAAIEEDAAKGSTETGALLVSKAFLQLVTANFDGVAASAFRMKQVHQIAPIPAYWYGHADYFRGLAAYERNQLDEAADAFTADIQYGVKLHSRHYHSALVMLASTKLASGDLKAASRIADQARQHSIAARDPTSTRVSDALEAMLLWTRNGRPLAKFPRPGIRDAVSYYPDVPMLMYAQVLSYARSERGLTEALSYIDEALLLARQRSQLRQVIVLSLLKAIALEALGNEDAAFELLRQCVRVGKDHDLIRTFLDRGPRLANLIHRMPVHDSLESYRAKLLSCFGANLSRNPDAPAHPAQQPPAALAMLSFREKEVLELMQHGLSNKQIAKQLEISSETVKKHAQGIYRKLDVKNRRQAVVQAEHIGLLRSLPSSLPSDR